MKNINFTIVDLTEDDVDHQIFNLTNYFHIYWKKGKFIQKEVDLKVQALDRVLGIINSRYLGFRPSPMRLS